MTVADHQLWLSIAEKHAAVAQTDARTWRHVRALCGADWPEFAARHGLSVGEAPVAQSAPAPRAVARAPAIPLPCRHRGGETGRELCPTCGGRVEVRVFACALYIACTLAKPLSGRACCATCPDRES